MKRPGRLYTIHGRPADYAAAGPADLAYYDGLVEVRSVGSASHDCPALASLNVYTIEELNANLGNWPISSTKPRRTARLW